MRLCMLYKLKDQVHRVGSDLVCSVYVAPDWCYNVQDEAEGGGYHNACCGVLRWGALGSSRCRASLAPKLGVTFPSVFTRPMSLVCLCPSFILSVCQLAGVTLPFASLLFLQASVAAQAT